LGTAFLAWQGNRPIDTSGEYVALGSSFAAGIGLGPRAPGSPLVCMRSSNGYPPRLATLTGLKLVDMSCSGSTSSHILNGGQVFQPAQLAAIGPQTRLVTITSCGNDVGYIGDLNAAAGTMGPIGKWLAGPVKPAEARDYAQVTRNLVQIVARIRAKAPQAQVVIVTYPAVVPPTGSCSGLRIDERQAAVSRAVAERLRAATRLAASQVDAVLVDAGAASSGHDACSAMPWISGAAPSTGVPFHPTAAGAMAVAALIKQSLSLTAP